MELFLLTGTFCDRPMTAEMVEPQGVDQDAWTLLGGSRHDLTRHQQLLAGAGSCMAWLCQLLLCVLHIPTGNRLLSQKG
jgi:hypothetical protein